MDMLLKSNFKTIEGLEITGEYREGFEAVLTTDAQHFLLDLHKSFNNTRLDLLKLRDQRQQKIDQGEMPDFLESTIAVREGEWTVAPLPPDLQDRRVEITGPVDRKMIINALNSGAKVFMADLEDSNSPNWNNVIQGQINLRDAINRTIDFVNPKNQKEYKLNETTATLMVRPRGWHLEEKNILVDGEPMSGGLVDFGLYFFHNAKYLLSRGTGPYFYLPKLESHLEARLWNNVFVFAQEKLDIPQKSIKATVLIETILASFELHEILFELKDHSAGLNCGRWDYIFSFIKKFKNLSNFTLPNRAQVGMTTHFMKSYSELVIQTCHKRGVHAMGGMAAQIPIKNNPEANEIALEKVRKDKLQEVKNGHDGTWVAHPALVKIASDIFDEHMPQKNQIENKRLDVALQSKDLLAIPEGTITEDGLRLNINVGLLYLESWLRGVGAAAIYNLMEDAATAEISRTQIWQWIKHQCVLEDQTPITIELYERLLKEELVKIEEYVGKDRYENGKFKEAIKLFDRLIKEDDFIDFLTLPAYNLI